MLNINVYDFDKTIYKGDSTLDFYIYILKKYPSTIKYIFIQILSLVKYKLKLKTKEYFKEKFFIFLNDLEDVDKEVELFWKLHLNKIRYNLFKNVDNIVIISASPEFLLKNICDKLGAIKLIATKVNKINGKFESLNCYGKEKVNRLNKEVNNYRIITFYSDSYSDKYLAQISEKSYIVKGGKVLLW